MLYKFLDFYLRRMDLYLESRPLLRKYVRLSILSDADSDSAEIEE